MTKATSSWISFNKLRIRVEDSKIEGMGELWAALKKGTEKWLLVEKETDCLEQKLECDLKPQNSGGWAEVLLEGGMWHLLWWENWTWCEPEDKENHADQTKA